MRVATVASTSGTAFSVDAPFIIGTPARQMLSLRTMRLPASGPYGAPLISDFTYQAPSGFSAPEGREPGVRGYRTSGR
jgi:hypothetical protein